MDQLPVDVLAHMFKFLEYDDFGSLLELKLVSKQFRQAFLRFVSGKKFPFYEDALERACLKYTHDYDFYPVPFLKEIGLLLKQIGRDVLKDFAFTNGALIKLHQYLIDVMNGEYHEERMGVEPELSENYTQDSSYVYESLRESDYESESVEEGEDEEDDEGGEEEEVERFDPNSFTNAHLGLTDYLGSFLGFDLVEVPLVRHGLPENGWGDDYECSFTNSWNSMDDDIKFELKSSLNELSQWCMELYFLWELERRDDWYADRDEFADKFNRVKGLIESDPDSVKFVCPVTQLTPLLLLFKFATFGQQDYFKDVLVPLVKNMVAKGADPCAKDAANLNILDHFTLNLAILSKFKSPLECADFLEGLGVESEIWNAHVRQMQQECPEKTSLHFEFLSTEELGELMKGSEGDKEKEQQIMFRAVRVCEETLKHIDFLRKYLWTEIVTEDVVLFVIRSRNATRFCR
jgi:hypothetical protein